MGKVDNNVVATVSGAYGEKLDIDQQYYLGGDTGLRGYPFRLFRVGAAVFFDMGRTWGDSVFGTSNDGLLRDVGFGLRLGNIDLAYPLDGDDDISNVQLNITLKQGF